MSLYTKNQGSMEEDNIDDEVKIQDDDSQLDTPTFGAVENMFGDEYEDLMAIAEMKVLSNVEDEKIEEVGESTERNMKKKVFVFSFKQDNAVLVQQETKEQVIDVSQDQNKKVDDETSKVVKSLKLLNIEEKPEPVPQPSNNPLKEARIRLAESVASSQESQSQVTNNTLTGSRCGTIISNKPEPAQNHSFSSLDLFESLSAKELNYQMAWKEEVFKIEADKKRRRIRPLKYWIGENMRCIKANQAIIRYRKKIVQTLVYEEDCQLIKASNTQIISNTLVKGEITVPAQTTVRLNWFWMLRVSVSQHFSLQLSENKLRIINQRGKSSLVIASRHPAELQNSLDVDCTLYLKIYSETH